MKRLAICLLGVTAACARGPAVQPLPSTAFEQPAIRQAITAALEADAAMNDADSLYVIGATVIADGWPRQRAPRYAGVQTGGQTAVTASALEITAFLAWGTVDYRWTARSGGGVALGRATFVLERMGGTWRIKHAHSSSVRSSPSREGGGQGRTRRTGADRAPERRVYVAAQGAGGRSLPIMSRTRRAVSGLISFSPR